MQHTFAVDGIDVLVEGEGDETVLMLHGWPDTHRLWDGQVAALRRQYRCVRFTLPGFDLGKPRRPCSLDDMTALIERIARLASPDRPVILLQHDWGSIFGTEFAQRHRQLVSRIVSVDVGDALTPEYRAGLGLGAKLAIVGYQLWLALAWRIGGTAGDGMSRMMAKAMKVPVDGAAIGSQMNYPYYITWMGAYGSYRRAAATMPACPTLYIYGRRKPFMFHSQAWIDKLNATAGSRAIAMQTGHWPMHEDAAEFSAAVQRWLAGF
ncbi:alpha/beta hydrolase [Massilia sp. Root351]|jgi:pimeloyl-ACP methyl ester carboxylesterase|uniref:alpha/beta fold hydrolase n=1 Tax=Massilia sp. Root351 TaxID=1736522 RepID=UPI00070DE27C|nr:alpha/beta hydrolase [Massilia sp. Root351]KQV84822.1 alpha/beta hydrolase [Massilia sp. Root351]